MLTIRRLVLAVLAVIIAVLGCLPATHAHAAGPSRVVAYSYDTHHHFDAPDNTTTERGPPTSYPDTGNAYDAVDRWSRGASARSHADGAGPTTTYATHETLAPGAPATTTTGRQVEVADGEVSALPSAGVAAESGEDWTRVGRWMHPDEHALMRDTGNIQWSRTSGTHRVSNPATPYAYRDAPASDFYVEYEVPTSVLRPHSEGTSIIYGPNSLQARLPGRAQPGDVPFRNLSEPWW